MLGGAERDMLALQARYAPTGRDIPRKAGAIGLLRKRGALARK